MGIGPRLSWSDEPLGVTLTLPFSLNDIRFFIAIVALAALIGLAAWLAHLWPKRADLLTKLPQLHERASLNALLWLAVLVAPVFVILSLLGLWAAFAILTGIIRGDALSSTGAGTMGTAAVLIVAVLGAPFVIWRAMVAQKTVNVAEQGMITDRINKSVAGLGAEKTEKRVVETPRYRKDKAGNWERDGEGRPIPETLPNGKQHVDREETEETRPNLEVRIGSIYALERIAKDSLPDHIQIMEILCAYIRENAPASQASKLPERPVFDAENIKGSEAALVKWKREHGKELAKGGRDGGPIRPREDIQVALTVIGRRSERQRARERGGTLPFAEAAGSVPPYPEEADSGSANGWRDAFETWKKRLSGWMEASPTYRLDLRRTDLTGADLRGAQLDRALLAGAQLNGANLMRAQLNGANLWSAQLNGAQLGSTRWTDAKVLQATVQRVDLASTDLSMKQIVTMFGDGSVVLPGGVTPEHPDWPAHWPKEELDPIEFGERYKTWLSQRSAAPAPQ